MACTAAVLGMLNIAKDANVFNMAGGAITVLDVGLQGDGRKRRAFEVNSLPANVSVTGGTVNLYVTPSTYNANERDPSPNKYDNADFLLVSSAPLGNLNIYRPDSMRTVQLIGIDVPGATKRVNQSLTILNALTIHSGVLNANNLDVIVGGNFALKVNSQYIPGTNTTTFNGAGNQTLSYVSINNFPSGFNHLTMNKPSGTLSLSGPVSILTVLGDLSLLKGTLNDGGESIHVKGNVINSATHVGLQQGKISLDGLALQTITGDGKGIFAHLHLNNANGVRLIQAGQTIANKLTLEKGILDIGTYPLTITSSLATAISSGVSGGFGNTKMIRTAGNQSDGGLVKQFGDVVPFTFPVGTLNTATSDQ